ncbi:hypothetical protein [Undibacterium sp. RuTC16W]|uniref:hypothetical protein n=1 Tax=Undibacterium sp. RuTC16W TaxID=3413048 RepID=UPI003BF1848A
MSIKEPHLQVYNAENKHIGHFDGQLFYTSPKVDLKVDGEEVYTLEMPCKLIGYYKNNSIALLDGTKLYYFQK